MKNSQYTREFRESSIQLVLNSNQEIKTIASNLGINTKTLYNWVYNYKKEHNITKTNTTKESMGEENARLHTRKPSAGLVWHTDRGSQYASVSHRRLLESHGVIQSMSAKGDCWDNAVSESFFGSLKQELVHHERFATRAEANQVIFEYIEIFYNRQRLHSYNGYISPVDFEANMIQCQNVA